jgi:hypothetical protein
MYLLLKTGYFRNASNPNELVAQINPKVNTIYEAFRQGRFSEKELFAQLKGLTVFHRLEDLS